MLYYNETWCRNDNNKFTKAKRCFNENGNLKILFIEKKNMEELKKFKIDVRQYYNKGNDSIHTPDTQEECNNMLDLLNTNTISFMDKASSLYIQFINFNKLFKNLKNFCKENNINTNKICITSSSVLSVYGIRDCNDMDLFIDKEYINIFEKKEFDNHNKYTIDKHYSKHYEDIIHNPENHFYYQNFKFCNLSIILDYKKYRIQNQLHGIKSIEKDTKDVKDIMNIYK